MEIVKQKTRQSNIELCRIVCMLMIIMHHLVLHGGLLKQSGMFTNLLIGQLVYPGGKVGFDAFIAISAWFLAKAEFKAERFVKTYLEVIFYSIVTTVIAACLGSQLTALQILGAFFPLTGAVAGYPATYLAFYLLMPFLSIVARRINEKQNIMLITVLAIFVLGSRIMSSIVGNEQSCYSRVTLFIFFFFLMLYCKDHPKKLLNNTAVMLVTFLVSWGLIVFYDCAGYIWPDGKPEFISKTTVIVQGEAGLLNIICGLSLFFFFKSITIRPNKVINFFAGSTLAVLVLHDGHFSRSKTWELLKTSEWYYSRVFPIRAAACAVGIYLVCTLVDTLRKKFLEKPLFSCKWMQQLCKSFDLIAVQPEVSSSETDMVKSELTVSCEEQIAALQKELDRKDKALAEIASRYALKED